LWICADPVSEGMAGEIAEALRKGAAEILEMELEDLQVLTLGRAGTEEVDVLLYDPMPGGSGLLEQMTARWLYSSFPAQQVIVTFYEKFGINRSHEIGQ
jgi:hypothetical protein